MLQFALKAAAPLAALLVLVLALIRSAPYDPDPIRHILDMAACSPPCFIGLQPGETTVDEAQAMLSRHPWVARVTVYRDTGGQPRNMTWDWNGQQPAALFGRGVADVQDGRIAHIRVYTRIRTGDLWLTYGPPVSGGLEYFLHFMDYPAQAFTASFAAPCGDYWSSFVNITIPADEAPAHYGYNLHNIRQMLCRESR